MKKAAPPELSSKPRRAETTTLEEQSYRCPACGQLVDGRDREAMLRHHRHVLFPRPFDRRPLPG